MYEFIDGEKACYPVVLMCRWAQVSRSGFYEWLERPASATAERRAVLAVEVRAVFEWSNSTYGFRRVQFELANNRAIRVGLELVRFLMADMGLVACQPGPWRLTTISGDGDGPTDLIRRDFTASAPGHRFVGDITYIPTWEGWLYLATVIDLHTREVCGAAIAAKIDAGTLTCPSGGCDGLLAPWGHARPRRLCLPGGRGETHTPRRVRCRVCRHTHVVVSTRSYPQRPDSVETVGAALLAAIGGLGHRCVADRVGLPATTVRGWLRRARANCDVVRADATVATHQLDPMAGAFKPTGSALGDTVDAVGRAISAWVLRLGPVPAPWQLAVALTGAAILAPVPRPVWRSSG